MLGNSLNKRLIRKFCRDFFLKYWVKELIIFILIIISSLLILLIPYFNKLLIDDALGEKNYEEFYMYLGLMIGVSILQVVISFIKDVLYLKIGEKILQDIREKLISHVLKLSPEFYQKITVGELMSRVDNDVRVLQEVSSSVFIEFIANIINMIFVVGIMLYFNVPLTVISLAIVMVYFLNYNYFAKQVKEKNSRARTIIGDIMSYLSEVFSNIITIKVFNNEKWVLNKFLRLYKEQYDRSIKLNIFQTLNINTAQILTVLAIGAIWLVGGVNVLQDKMTIGGIVAFVSYQSRLFSPLRLFSSLNNEIQSAIVALDRIYEILEEEPRISDKIDAINLDNYRGEVEFSDVTFSYIEEEKILNKLSFKINQGETIAIVGKSGCGKSSIHKLLTRLYEPQTGKILLDGKDINKFSIDSVRKQVGVIPQEIDIFKDSVYDNLFIDTNLISKDELDEIIKKVDIYDYITSLPYSYDTILGENGSTLSGGQKKRIGIARTLLRKYKLLIIDEAMSSLDNERKSRIKSIISELKGKCTIIIISHELSEIHDVDRIFVIDNGQIVDQGSHEQLIIKESLYKDLYNEISKSNSMEVLS